MITLKPGVKLHGLQPQVVMALAVCDAVYDSVAEVNCIVTSANDGVHSATSLHYAGAAVDLRTRHITPEEAEEVVAAIKQSIGSDFDVILESDHIHLEYQPRRT